MRLFIAWGLSKNNVFKIYNNWVVVYTGVQDLTFQLRRTIIDSNKTLTIQF